MKRLVKFIATLALLWFAAILLLHETPMQVWRRERDTR